MFFVYILYSSSVDQFYIGQTNNLEERISRHNSGRSKSTKKANDWVLRYSESFETRSEAVKRELQIKNMKSRRYIENLINPSSQPGIASRPGSGRSQVRILPPRLTPFATEGVFYWSGSSVGQSNRFLICGSGVRIPSGSL